MKLLLVEDNPADVRLIREMLKEAPPGSIQLTVADRLDRALETLPQDPPEVVVLDLGLPDSQGLATLTSLQRACPAVPVVVLTGLNDQAFAIEAVRAGAQDYLVKGRINCDLLLRTMHYAIERQRSSQALHESEARKRAVLESALEAIITINHQGQVLEFNPAAERMFGYRAVEVIGQELAGVLIPPAFRDAHRRGLAHFVDKGEGLVVGKRIQLTGLRRDGTEFPIELAITRIGTDAPPSFTGFIRDITERQRAEEQLRLHATALEAAANAIVITDIKGTVLWVNPAFTALTGYTADEALGQNPRLLKSGRHETAFYAHLWQTILAGQVWHGEMINRRKDGSLYPEEQTITPVRDAGGGITRFIAIKQEITERKRAEEEIRRLNAELEERVRQRTAQLEAANQELEAFSYSVSHDLRAPLRHIAGFVHLLQKSAGPALAAPSRHHLDQITESATEMGRLIDDLLVFSRMGRAHLRQEPLDWERLLEDAIHGLHSEVQGRHILWKKARLPAVRADAAMLHQVLLNLLSNAVKYTRPRDPAEIEIGCASDTADEAVIFVRDNGVGFDMEYAGKLFGVFQRLHRDDEFEGTGIGLANVRRIIARHQGRTWAEGRVNGGATFYFSLPKHG